MKRMIDMECSYCAECDSKHIELKLTRRDDYGNVSVLTYICPECNAYTMIKETTEKKTEKEEE